MIEMKASDYEKAIEENTMRYGNEVSWRYSPIWLMERAREIAAARQASEPAGGECGQLERWGLPTQLKAAQICSDGYWTPWHIAQADRDRLAAELAEAKRDAERYRWLVDGNAYEHADAGLPYIVKHVQNDWGKWREQVTDPASTSSEIDAAIDAAARNKP